MTILSFLFQGFLILILCVSFLIGIVLMIIAIWKNPINKTNLLKGFALFIFPLLIFIYYSIKPSLLYEIDDREIIGIYKISSSSENIDNLNDMRLVLYKNGTFVLNKPIPNVNICNNGTYDFEPELEENALAFHCDNVINVQGIKRNYSNFELEFRLGDADENRYYYLEKIDN